MVFKLLRSLLAPPFCAACKSFLSHDIILCDGCAQSVPPLVSVTHKITNSYSLKVFAAGAYRQPLKSLVLAKSRGDIVASTQLARLIWQRTNVQHAEFDVIVPIPLHWTRFARRGFNQAEEIAKELSRLSGKPVVNVLVRTKRTVFQSSLPHNKRGDNVKTAFTLADGVEKKYRTARILLVDDLMTTGSTLHAAARTLIALKPHTLTAAVACRIA